MKAALLLKHNIDALLKARHQNRHELAVWVRQSTNSKVVDPWISKIFTRPDAAFQLKYLDRIADFFGIAVYQLFQPGISPLTERRCKGERRRGQDRRRITRADEILRPAVKLTELEAQLRRFDDEGLKRVARVLDGLVALQDQPLGLVRLDEPAPTDPPRRRRGRRNRGPQPTDPEEPTVPRA